METNAREFAGKYVKVEGKKVKVPAFSDWDQKCDCCGCKVAYFPEIDAYFCNQWECQFKYPVLVLSVVIISLFFAIWSVIDLFSGTNRIIILAVFGVTFIFWIISYFCAMCRSPGYLPWYWAVQKGTQYSYQEQMDGVITTEEQKYFVTQFSKPERDSLTKKE